MNCCTTTPQTPPRARGGVWGVVIFKNLNKISIIEIFTAIFEDDKTFWTALVSCIEILIEQNLAIPARSGRS